jgi:hypothetical protein
VQLKAKASVMNPRTGEAAIPRFPGGERPQVTAERDELLALADWLAHSPMFARMQVNRIWHHLLGRGLVDPVDDFRASNPPSHPELLDALAGDFAKNGYDLRRTIRTIMASRVYQLSSEPNGTNETDETNHSRGLVRRLGAEQLIDSTSQVLAAPLAIDDWPEAKRLAQVLEGRKHYHPLKTDLDRFALALGKPPRLIATECERTDEPTVVQAFQLISGPAINDLLTRKDNRLRTWAASTSPSRETVEEAFWTALSRPPSDDERTRFTQHLESAKDKRHALEDLAWALLNSKEFVFRR